MFFNAAIKDKTTSNSTKIKFQRNAWIANQKNLISSAPKTSIMSSWPIVFFRSFISIDLYANRIKARLIVSFAKIFKEVFIFTIRRGFHRSTIKDRNSIKCP